MTTNPAIDDNARHDLDTVPYGVGERQDFPRDSSVLDLFEAVVRSSPQRAAVRFGSSSLSFAEVDAAAQALADAMQDRGVVPGTLLPVLIGNSQEFPVAIMGAMKAGAVYVPVDPDWPSTRIASTLCQLKPAVTLTVRSAAPVAARQDGAGTLLFVDDALAAPAVDTPPATMASRPGPEDLIYGYFTSGSTGTPKCTLNRHRGLVNRLTAMSRHFGDGAKHVVLQNSRPTFDSSMWQILWPLTTGGQVIIPDRHGILDLEETCRIIGRYGITITDFVPSVLSALVSLLELSTDLVETLSGLRRMLIGGEAANQQVLLRLHALLPHLLVTNTYGPTECSIGSVFHDIDFGNETNRGFGGGVPLGSPIPNTAALVLGDDMCPLPPGKVGEIFMGGECVGAGYLNDPERTANAFVDNPFRSVPGAKLYRTGDLGHVDPDGLLMFDGRRDEQVKVGGVRIELAEVERVLLAVPGVQDAAVVAIGEGAGRSLVGFFTAVAAAPTLEISAMVARLRQQLPAEVVPRRVVRLSELPLTPNGKLDRRQLEQLATAAPGQASTTIVAPASGTEELVAAVWREVLQIQTVSVDVAFADYGGTSLLAHRIGTLLGNRLGRPVKVADLLRADTVRAQAALLLAGDHTASAVAAGHAAQLRADMRVAELGSVRARPAPMRSHRVLLTGATGFVGAHLLAELLARPTVSTVCLVRAGDVRAAQARLRGALERYRLDEAVLRFDYGLRYGQVRALVGDLGAPELGLPQRGFARLSREIDVVLHAGARVNFLFDYLGHRADNVLGTRELLRLALAGDGCRLHVLSTFSAFGAAQLAGVASGQQIDEDSLPDPDLPPDDGYSQSKYVVEHVLENCRRYGLDSVVYRLGEIWPHSRTGMPNIASIAQSLVYACARTGIAFPTGAATNHLPVDLVAGYLTNAVVDRRPPGGRVHVLRPAPLRFTDIFDRLVAAGVAEPGGYPDFWRRLHELVEQDGADELLVRAAMLLPAPRDAEPGAPAELDAVVTDCSQHFAVGRFTTHAPTAAALVMRSALDDLTPFLDRLAVPEVSAVLGEWH